MWFLTAIFQAVGQAVTWVLPVSETGHSSIFHDFSGRFSGNVSELTGLVHIGIALGFIIVFYKLFIKLGAEFFMGWKELFTKKLNRKETSGLRRFMYFSFIALIPMLFLFIPAGQKFFNVYGLLNTTGYNKTLFDDGVFFAITGLLLLFASVQLKKRLNNKQFTLPVAIAVGFAAAVSLPISGLSLVATVFCLSVIMGVSKKQAFRFAAVLSVPTLIVLGISEIYTCVTYVNIFAGVLAVVLSAAASFFVIKLTLWIVSNAKFQPFMYYNFSVGGLCAIIGLIEIFVRK